MNINKNFRQYVWKCLSTLLYTLEVEILFSTVKELVGTKGKIVNETSKTLIIQTNRKTIKVPKKTSVFLITLPDGTKIRVNGIILTGRPEQRLKKQPKFW
ncbi:MAG: ribonuclease P protein component 1 [Candidatus Heimdallarchaeaceae archaeon]